ncbi:hypothetical protein HF680_15420 [Brevundimonas sp. WCHBH090558]|nr:hypothetical protein [Brevundimonas huaxiensis]
MTPAAGVCDGRQLTKHGCHDANRAPFYPGLDRYKVARSDACRLSRLHRPGCVLSATC